MGVKDAERRGRAETGGWVFRIREGVCGHFDERGLGVSLCDGRSWFRQRFGTGVVGVGRDSLWKW